MNEVRRRTVPLRLNRTSASPRPTTIRNTLSAIQRTSRVLRSARGKKTILELLSVCGFGSTRPRNEARAHDGLVLVQHRSLADRDPVGGLVERKPEATGERSDGGRRGGRAVAELRLDPFRGDEEPSRLGAHFPACK